MVIYIERKIVLAIDTEPIIDIFDILRIIWYDLNKILMYFYCIGLILFNFVMKVIEYIICCSFFFLMFLQVLRDKFLLSFLKFLITPPLMSCQFYINTTLKIKDNWNLLKKTESIPKWRRIAIFSNYYDMSNIIFESKNVIIMQYLIWCRDHGMLILQP